MVFYFRIISIGKKSKSHTGESDKSDHFRTYIMYYLVNGVDESHNLADSHGCNVQYVVVNGVIVSNSSPKKIFRKYHVSKGSVKYG